MQLTAAEATLLERANPLSCEVQRSDSQQEATTATAEVACAPGDDTVDNVELRTFEDAAQLRDAWQAGLDNGSTVNEARDACANETPGARKWGYGNIVCLVDGDTALIRWTDARIGTFGEVTGSSDDIDALYDWWRANARKVGRSDDEAQPGKAQEPKATPKPKTPKKPLVRVPGKPRSAVCTAAGITIPDEWDRSWRLRTVEFLDRAGYERVILKLEKTGRNGTNTATRAAIERMSFGRLTDRVPSASKPRRGKAAIVIDLDGVRQAPKLRGYRPSGLTLAKELSIFRSPGGHTVVIGAPADTCYQMRIPVWGPNATGKERKAEIFIDLKPPSR